MTGARGETQRVHRAAITLAVCVTAALVVAPRAGAQPIPWHAPGWAQRVVVKVESAMDPNLDTAAVRIVHAGAAAANDFRIFDAAGGKAVPYQVTFHDKARYSLISFRGTLGGVVCVYFGKPDAPADPMRAIDAELGKGAPQPGPAAEGWTPKAGLVLVSMRRPREAPNPETPDDMTKLVAAAPALDGAGYRFNISDGLNPYGDSDHYVSVYRGWLRVPSAGNYGFCTASNEASFSFLDGKELVHWPGRHTEDRGRRGEKNVERDLEAGLHYVEYLHEEVLLYQVAFLGCKPPGADRYNTTPPSYFPQPHRAAVVRYENASGQRLVAPRVELVDSRWPPGRGKGQHTRFRFAAEAGSEGEDLSKWTIDWSFGDGQTARGASVDHLYLTTGAHDVKMAATGPAGQRVEAAWPLAVFQVDHLSEGFKEAKLAAYAPLAASFDVTKLTAPALAELARLKSELGDAGGSKAAAQAALERSDLAPDDAADLHVMLATRASGKPEETAAHLKAALDKQPDPAQRTAIAARLIRAVGVDASDAAAAEALYAQIEQTARAAGLKGPMRKAFRDATIALGDAHLYAKRIDRAAEDYRTAEALAEPPIPQPVRLSKVGAFTEAIEQHLDKSRVEEALRVMERWRNEIPSDQIRGALLFYEGKLNRLQGRAPAAVRPLQLAIELAQGADFEAEARWLLAECYRDAGDAEAARRTLSGLVRAGIAGPYRERAVAALAAAPTTQPGDAK